MRQAATEMGREEVGKDSESEFHDRHSPRSASKSNNTLINCSTGRAILGRKPKNMVSIMAHPFISDEYSLNLGLRNSYTTRMSHWKRQRSPVSPETCTVIGEGQSIDGIANLERLL